MLGWALSESLYLQYSIAMCPRPTNCVTTNHKHPKSDDNTHLKNDPPKFLALGTQLVQQDYISFYLLYLGASNKSDKKKEERRKKKEEIRKKKEERRKKKEERRKKKEDRRKKKEERRKKKEERRKKKETFHLKYGMCLIRRF